MSAAARASHEQEIALARDSLGDETFSEAWAVGLAMSLEDAVDELRTGASS
jgi:hypothetical protein